MTFEGPRVGTKVAEATASAPHGRRTVAAIVPAYNAAMTLPACLAALSGMTRAFDQLIVFNDGSTDKTEAIAREAGATVLVNPGGPLGPAHGRNVGAAAASADLLLFVDADVVIAPDALERLVGEMEAHGAQAAFGSYDDDPPSRRPSSLYANLRHHFVHQANAGDASTFWSGLGIIERETFLQLGGFDAARFPRPSIEDVELGVRLVASGARVRLAPAATAKHLKDWTVTQVWRTDILQRAYPWSCLLADGDTPGADLNLSPAERIKAVLAVASLLLLGASLAAPPLLIPAAAALLAYVVLNRAFFGLLARKIRGAGFLQAVAMHWCYHLYSSATFASVAAATRLGLRRPRLLPSSPETRDELCRN